MNWNSKTIFNKHEGMFENSSGKSTFYGLVFENNIQMTQYLKDVKPDREYKAWSCNGQAGLYDVQNKTFLLQNKWFTECEFKKMMDLQE